MALDTAQRRLSALTYGQVFVPGVVPVGAVDRQATAYSYAGIAADTPIVITDYTITAGIQMLATKFDTLFPLEVSVDSSGGVTGLSVKAAIRDTGDSTSFLDFDDMTFKTSGWTTKQVTLTDYANGYYGTTVDITAITNLPDNKSLAVEFDVGGSITAIKSSFITFLDDYLTTGNFIGLQ